ncbi:early endosome antigen 1 isoform X2 [Macrosteles quadrilineatus]|uniref:early endosome antigen 1 isoform X2 n=1 Tax=Macrosteles quadrilineatus TaxID=74068 RepID=UPI0023E12B31|nr:early endosome antigen 1 isoform X2 [Macrosteles quadrilineatus]
MQHIKGKGDPLCPLGFHPQVRWPTRCKRCFRDYKEHGNKKDGSISLRRDETTVSSPSLSSWATKGRDDSRSSDSFSSRSWTSSSNLNLSSSDLSSKKTEEAPSSRTGFSQAASSWTSSPNLANMKEDSSTPTVSFTLRRRPSVETSQEDQEDYRRTQYTVRRRTSGSNLTATSPTTETPSRSFTRSSVSRESPSPAERVRTSPSPSERVRTSPSPISDRFRTSPSPAPERTRERTSTTERPKVTPSTHSNSSDVEFLIKLKSSKPPIPPKKSTPASTKSSSSSSSESDEDDVSTTGTETTETTLVNDNSELQEQIESLKRELEMMKARCERVEREKSDILLRRLDTIDSTRTKATASETIKMQQKVNELQSTVEDLRDDKKSLALKVKELEADLEKTKEIAVVEKEAEALRAKLHAAETLCEELMDENEDMKKELRDLEEEMDEMQDNFREEQADEYTSLKKELEQSNKNCRILSFKLRKSERKAEALEAEKLEAEKKCRELAGGQSGLDKAERIRHLEQELARSNEVAKRLQADLEEAKKSQPANGATKKKAPMLSVIGKSSSGEKMSRETLTRGGSQEDPVQLLRDLQDSMEREADLREQLRFAEEEIFQLQTRKQKIVISRKAPPFLEEDVGQESNITSVKTQTLLTRLTSLASQMISVQTQTDIYKESSSQTEPLQRKSTESDIDMEDSVDEIGVQSDIKNLNSEASICSVCKRSILSDCFSKTNIQDSEAQTDFYAQVEEIGTQTISSDLKDSSTQSQSITPCCKEISIQTTSTELNEASTQSVLPCCDERSVQTTSRELKESSTQFMSPCFMEMSTQTVFAHLEVCLQTDILNLEDRVIQTDDQTSIVEDSTTENIISRETFSDCETQTDLTISNENSSQTDTLHSIKGRKTSPTPSRLTPEPPVEKDEGISDEEDPAELRLLLELNEQEAAVLRRKVEELEGVEDMLKRKVKELQEKLTSKTTSANRRDLLTGAGSTKDNIHEKKIKVLEEEMNELRKKLLDKERECERLNTELTLTQKKPKTLQKSKSLDYDQQALDLKRQLQVVEQEANVLRSRNTTLETENEKLLTENKRLSLTQAKKSPLDRTSIDTKLRVVELEKKLEEANKKLAEKGDDSKGKTGIDVKKTTTSTSEVEKLKKDLLKAETEKNKLNAALTRLKEESIIDVLKFYKERTPKKPTDITTKLQMKKMVEDLESEIGEILSAFKKCHEEKEKSGGNNIQNNDVSKFKTEIDELTRKLEDYDKEKKTFREEKAKLEKLLKTAEEEKKQLDESVTRITSKTELEKKALKDAKLKLEKEKKELESKLEKMSKDKNSSELTKSEIETLNKKIEKLEKDLKEEKSNTEKLKSELEVAKTAGKENSQLSKDSVEKTKKIVELEKKFKEAEEKLKKSEKLVATKKERITKLTKELDDFKKEKSEELENSTSEKDSIKSDLNRLEDKVKQLQDDISNKNSLIETLEGNLRKERERATDATVKAGSAASREINQLREELTQAKANLQELKGKLTKVENDKNDLGKSAKETEIKLEKEIKSWESKVSDLELELQTTRKASEKLKAAHEKELKLKEEELSSAKDKIKQAGGKKVADTKLEYQAKIDKLELALSSEKREYDDLTAKYEQLEEEHVVMKSKLVMEKETVQAQLLKVQQDLDSTNEKLESLKESTETKEKLWKKEKSTLEEKIQGLEKKVKSGSDSAETWVLEKNRLNAIIDEKGSIIEQLKKEQQNQLEQIDHMHKEIEEYRKKMEDYERLANSQRNMSAEQADKEREIKDLKQKLQSEERARKVEVSELKMRYENRVTVISDELTQVQGQVSRFKRERDTFKHMLEGAQKTIAELKASGNTPRSSVSFDDSEEYRGQITALEQQISCMEDELSEARLESSRLKTELVSERSAWEIKMSEMTSKLNELEEDRILSGRTKIAGLKSRLELAWQKEREDQQRLLQETSTLARDLRQTLFEVERERDKERLESKRKLEQLKKTVEEEQDENKKKMTELQNDLLELRDAHAKLRTTNEKLRRDKERFEKERESLKAMTTARRKAEIDDDRKINSLLQLVDELMRLAPDLFPSKSEPVNVAQPTPPARRKGSKSRETSPMVERRDLSKESSPAVGGKSEQMQIVLSRLTEATQELRRSQRAAEERDRERARRAFAARRAGSTDSDASGSVSMSVAAGGAKRKGSLYRKSLSLEQTSALSAVQDKIWKDDREGSLTSMQSLDDTESKYANIQRRDPSLDSRLSGGSTQSEVLPSDKKQKKGLFGKLKKLTKSSRSVDHDREYALSETDRGSDTSLGSIGVDDPRGSKSNLKDRIVDIFKKSGSTSRAGSMERGAKPPLPSQPDVGSDSTQRPLRATSMTRTEPSPARSDVSQSSVSSRPAATPSAVKRPPGSAPLLRKTAAKK